MKTYKKIYFICPQNKKPAGGVKQMYRMVDCLNNSGIEAYIIHKKPIKNLWFKNTTKIKYNPYIFRKIRYLVNNKNKLHHKILLLFSKLKSFEIEDDVLLVYPEIFGDKFHKLYENDFVIFNQNCYYTFSNYHDELIDTPYNSPKNKGVIVVSEDSKKYLSYTFPHIEVYQIRLGIDHENFSYSGNKKKQIAYMPRKLEQDIIQVINILKTRNQLAEWEFVAIDNIPENEVACILKESWIFLSFNHSEGLGLPPLEAMACGCIVIGYTGQGGNEYFNNECNYKISNGNIVEYCKTIEKVVENIDNKDFNEIAKGEKASNFVSENFNIKNENETILASWRKILNRNSK